MILTIIALHFFTLFYLSSSHPIICTLKQGIACSLSSAILPHSTVVLHSYINSGKSSGVHKPSFHKIYTLSHHSFFAYISSTVSSWLMTLITRPGQGGGKTWDRMDTNDTVRLEQKLNSKILLKEVFWLNQNFHLQGLQFTDTAWLQE